MAVINVERALNRKKRKDTHNILLKLLKAYGIEKNWASNLAVFESR